MTDSTQRKQWAEHRRDEAAALQAQQRSAGDSHSPVAGPLPFSADDLESAVRAERERCAVIADGWASEGRLRQAFADMTEWELRAAAEVARAVGRSIRGGSGA
jgi:hypothetical protein